MPRFNVEHKGQWACFSSVTESFVTPFEDKTSYENWRVSEYGTNCDPIEKSNTMTMEKAVFSMRVNKSREKSLQLLMDCGLTEKDSVELLDAVDEKYYRPIPTDNGEYKCPNCGAVVKENQEVCNDEHCCLEFVWKKNQEEIKTEQAKFEVKHIDQTLEDFQKDIHRFKVEYNGKSYDAYCVGALTINIVGHIPKDVYNKVVNKIWDMIDECENTDAWPVPDGAQKIADDYHKEEFRQEVSE